MQVLPVNNDSLARLNNEFYSKNCAYNTPFGLNGILKKRNSYRRTDFSSGSDMTKPESDILNQVKAFADQAHGDQMRRYTNDRYIVHPVRVMEIVREYNKELPVLAAALLHDVLEDTPVGKRELEKFLLQVMDKAAAHVTLQLVEELTDVYVKADYPGLNRRARKSKEVERLSRTSPDAQTIKYADIIDNIVEIVHNDSDFALVFIRECKQLMEGLNRGNPQLYQRAMQTVNDCMREFWDNANVKAL